MNVPRLIFSGLLSALKASVMPTHSQCNGNKAWMARLTKNGLCAKSQGEQEGGQFNMRRRRLTS